MPIIKKQDVEELKQVGIWLLWVLPIVAVMEFTDVKTKLHGLFKKSEKDIARSEEIKSKSEAAKGAETARGQKADLLFKYGLLTAVGGKGIEKNASISRSAFERAAWMGHGIAQDAFAEFGQGKYDGAHKYKYKWYLLATKTVPSDQAFPLTPEELSRARGILAELEAKLTPFDKEDGQFMARNFKPAQTEAQVGQLMEEESEQISKRRKERARIEEERQAELIADEKAAVVEAAKAKMDAAQERAAFFWLKKATDGEAGAQLEVGLRYLSGKGVLVDTNLAMHWLKAAADQGDSKAKAELIKLGIQ